ncbi:long-chain-fatty-acid--CoA ligase [Aeribacillus pallidus]|uniref:long-chain-fatty-acid--CoA ligase n=1 Tax=Aeribacillus pallidus TaxID=33936 RepID=UPI001E48E13C|nr:long-chain-fatty-acid--CoA ligase [Aeribacillus pallidus]
MDLNVSIHDVFEKAYKRYPDKEFIYDGYKRLTYKDIKQMSDSIASAFHQLGIGKGDRIIACLPNWHEFLAIYFAIAKIGAILVPCNTRYRVEELSYIVANSGAKAIFVVEEHGHFHTVKSLMESNESALEMVFTVRFQEDGHHSFEDLLKIGQSKLPPQVSIDPKEDVFSILYTSGTTGLPKGAMLTHLNFVHNAACTVEALQCDENDVFLVVVPVFHVFGMVPSILAAVTACDKMVFMEQFKAEAVLKMIEQEKITIHHGVPTMFILELNHPQFKSYDLSSLRTGIIAAAPCPVEVVKKIRNEMGCNITISYGQTETSPVVTITSFTDSDIIRSETVGRTIPGVEIKVVDVNRQTVPTGEIGELAVRGLNVMKGYFNMPEKTKEAIDQDGWLYTGDLVTLDEQGYVRIVGRKKEMIIRGGYNIYPREIEEILYKHPNVVEVAIIGLPDTVLGEISCAAVKLKDGALETEESMKNYLKGKIADYKIPDKVVFVDELPMTPSGKIKKVELQKKLKEDLQTELR